MKMERKKKRKVERIALMAVVCAFLAGKSVCAQEADDTIQDAQTAAEPAVTEQSIRAQELDVQVNAESDITEQSDEKNLEETGYAIGDLNGDDSINLMDLMLCLNHVAKKSELTGDALAAADINGDGKVDLLDLMPILNYVSKKTTEISGGSDDPKEHTHSYTATLTQEATCVEEGVVTYTCGECGDTYTEAIPATGRHSWEHFEAAGHTEMVLVEGTWVTTVNELHTICDQCGLDFGAGADSEEKAVTHIAVSEDCQSYSSKYVSVEILNHGVSFEEQWVQDSPAYDKCAVCGAIK